MEESEATELLKDEDEVVKLDLKIQERKLKVRRREGKDVRMDYGYTKGWMKGCMNIWINE